MRTIAVFLLSMALLSCTSGGGPAVTAAAPESEEFQIEATVLAVYNVLSGPAGRRDWNRFEALFAPGAQMVMAGTVLTPKEYATRNTPVFNEKSWFEHPVATRTMRYGDVAHVWSTYELRAAASDEKPLARGINSFQLVRFGDAWKVQSLVRQEEDATRPLPSTYLPAR